MSDLPTLTFYLVRNHDGQYFRRSVRDGYGEHWVDDPADATVYQKLGPARARVTWWARNYPSYGVPVLVKLTVSATEELHETERFEKADRKHREAEAAQEARRAAWRIKEAEAALLRAREELRAAGIGPK